MLRRLRNWLFGREVIVLSLNSFTEAQADEISKVTGKLTLLVPNVNDVKFEKYVQKPKNTKKAATIIPDEINDGIPTAQ